MIIIAINQSCCPRHTSASYKSWKPYDVFLLTALNAHKSRLISAYPKVIVFIYTKLAAYFILMLF